MHQLVFREKLYLLREMCISKGDAAGGTASPNFEICDTIIGSIPISTVG
jgi:hypothetical protein